jgi:hypothetical protein
VLLSVGAGCSYAGIMNTRLLINARTSPQGRRFGKFTVEAELTYEGNRLKEAAEASFQLADDESEDLRWYWEDSADSPLYSAELAAARIERLLPAVGSRFFGAIFLENPSLFSLWKKVPALPDVRVEIASADETASLLPWELMRSPDDSYIALEAREFVRAMPDAKEEVGLPGEELRVLLVISRPYMHRDLAYQAVASRIVHAVHRVKPEAQFTVLRPPTVRNLEEVLNRATNEGRPFQIVHFDGHGRYVDGTRMSPDLFVTPPSPGLRGYLLFENPIPRVIAEQSESHPEHVSGEHYGRLLAANGVRVAIFNSCRSGYASDSSLADVMAFRESGTGETLAEEVMTAGADAVVAMRYSVYLETAATYMGALYQHLAEGAGVGRAAGLARKSLREDGTTKLRNGRKLEDWPIPVCYERGNARLCPKRDTEVDVVSNTISQNQPSKPLVFATQERTLHLIDRAFDQARVVVLTGMRGSGKTTIAEQFAAWYKFTNGVPKVVWSRWNGGQSPRQILDALIETLRKEIVVPWNAELEATMAVNFQEAWKNVDVLWIWDGVGEVLASDSASESSAHRELLTFVRSGLEGFRESGIKILLVSHNDCRSWLSGRVIWVNVMKLDETESALLVLGPDGELGSLREPRVAIRGVTRYADGNASTLRLLSEGVLRDAEASDLNLGAATFEVVRDRLPHSATAILNAASNLVYKVQRDFGEKGEACLRMISLFRSSITPSWVGLSGKGNLREASEVWRGVMAEIADRGLAASTGLAATAEEETWLLHPMLGIGVYEAMQRRASDEEKRYFATTRAEVGTSLALGSYMGQAKAFLIAGREIASFEHALYCAQQLRIADASVDILDGMTVASLTGGIENGQLLNLIEKALSDFVDGSLPKFKPNCERNGIRILSNYAEVLLRMGRLDEAKRSLELALPAQRGRVRVAARAKEAQEQAEELLRFFKLSICMASILIESADPHSLQNLSECSEIAERSNNNEMLATAFLCLGAALLEMNDPHNLEKTRQFLNSSLGRRNVHDVLGQGYCHFQLGNWFRKGWILQLIHMPQGMKLAKQHGVKSGAQIGIPNKALNEYNLAIDLLGGTLSLELCRSHRRAGQLNAVTHIVTSGLRNSDYLEVGMMHFSRAAEIAAKLENKVEYGRAHLEAADFLEAVRRTEAASEHMEAAGKTCGVESKGWVRESSELVAALKSIRELAHEITLDGRV